MFINESTVLSYTAAQLRGWLYQYYSQRQQWDNYDEVHRRANLRNKRRRIDLTESTLLLREKLFAEMNPD